jgi:hypothetical protein
MATIVRLALLAVLPVAIFAASQNRAGSDAQGPTFRDPFALRLRIDKQHYYEERFDRIPYVAQDDVYLFAGEHFGIKATIANNEISGIAYEWDGRKSDVEFAFSQEKAREKPMMMLVIQNRLKHRLFMDAVMTVPGKEGLLKTTILPIDAGLADYESWPHPIVQLVLRDFRFSEKPSMDSSENGGARSRRI